MFGSRIITYDSLFLEITNVFILVTDIVVYAVCITLAQTHARLHNPFINTIFCIKPSTVSIFPSHCEIHILLYLQHVGHDDNSLLLVVTNFQKQNKNITLVTRQWVDGVRNNAT